MKPLNRILSLLLLVLVLVTAPPAGAQALGNYLKNKLVDSLFRGVSFSPAATLYVGLSVSACSATSTGTEASYTGYSRAAITSNTTNWAATNSVGSTNNPSSGTSGQTSNNGTVTIGSAASSGPQTMTHMFIADALSGGNLYICKQLAASKTVNSGDPAPTFSAGTLTVTFN